MKVAVVQIAYADGEPLADRRERAAGLVRAQAGADLVLLPELWAPTGFGYRGWAAAAEPLDGPTVAAIAKAARSIGSVVHAGSIIEALPEPGPEGKVLANTSVLLGPDGSRLAVYRKIHRFGFAEGEPSLLEAGREIVVVDLPGGGPRVGLSTCYDLRFPELYRAQVDRGAQVFLVPAAWPRPRVAHWSLLGRARAVENQCVLVAANTGGTHAGYVMGGASQVVSPRGDVLAEAGGGAEILTVEVDLGEVTAYRREFPVLADRRL
ncbi:MAG: carbon-nitrogen family hydrolase [Dermatophilaceae bacterium]